jgi:acyl carrier protein
MERAIASIWRTELDVRKVGLHDNHFDLGGHSLTAIRIMSSIGEWFGIRLTFRDFVNWSLGQLAARCEELVAQKNSSCADRRQESSGDSVVA